MAAQADSAGQEAIDRRFMAAAIRLSRSHEGLTSTNPSVATLIVRDDGAGPVIVGRGVTAIGGRPHAEPQALDEAGALARGATAYVTLEPCAHHGRTPPCANALVAAGVARVVGAASDPDPRVSGKGYAILRAAGIAVVENVLADEAADLMAAYLIRSSKKRAEVTLKLALSRDGMIGRKGAGQVAITGEIARRQVQLMRARSDAILVGIGTALADDPLLTVRLPGLEARSPARIVLDRQCRLPLSSKLVATAHRGSAVRRGLSGGRSGAQGGAGKGRRQNSSPPRRSMAASRCRSCWRIWRGRASPASWSRAAPIRCAPSSRTGWSIASCCSAAMSRSAPTALPRRSTRQHIPAGFVLKRDEKFGNDRCVEWARGV